MVRGIRILSAAALLAAVAPTTASAATLGDLGLSAEQLAAIRSQAAGGRTSAPGITFGSPAAFGAGWGAIGFGVGGTTLPDNAGDDDYDGAASVVFGLGNAADYVALETVVTAVSLRESFGDDGNVGFKLHTQLPGRMAVGVGVENTMRWGRPKDAGTESSHYVVATKFVDWGSMPVAVNLGLGDERFNDPGDSGVNLFGGLALGFAAGWSGIADWSGNTLNLGVSAAPLPRTPLTFTAGVTNVTERFDADSEFAAGIGYTVLFK
ncbi:MAG TPA: hypothetical protein VFV27_06525 [Nevskiaceae bacterium]|nr:hypothetical protein [Nevskiaceae bacterium]